MNIREEMKDWRKRNKLNTREAAKQANMSNAYWCQLENGKKISDKMRNKIKKCLDKDIIFQSSDFKYEEYTRKRILIEEKMNDRMNLILRLWR